MVNDVDVVATLQCIEVDLQTFLHKIVNQLRHTHSMKACLIQPTYLPGCPFYGLDPLKQVRKEWFPDFDTIDSELILKQDAREQVRKVGAVNDNCSMFGGVIL
jgi:hypothetical protein